MTRMRFWSLPVFDEPDPPHSPEPPEPKGNEEWQTKITTLETLIQDLSAKLEALPKSAADPQTLADLQSKLEAAEKRLETLEAAPPPPAPKAPSTRKASAAAKLREKSEGDPPKAREPRRVLGRL